MQSRHNTIEQELRKSRLRAGWQAAAMISLSLLICVLLAGAAFYYVTRVPSSPATALSTPTIPLTTPLAVTSTAETDKVPAGIKMPAVVRDHSFQTLTGKTQRLADYSGKVLVLDIWATWCGPCRLEIPHLSELAREFKTRGVEVIGFTTEDPATDTAKVQQFVSEFRINYAIAWARDEFALHLMQGRNTIPQTYVIGRDGTVYKHLIGFNAQASPAQLRAAVTEALAAR